MTRRPRAAAADPGQADLFGTMAPLAAARPPETPPVPDVPTEARLLDILADWAERGWLRRLDAALPRFLADAARAAETASDAGAPALLAAAIVSHLEGRGHACLAIAEWLESPERALGWQPEPLAALAAVLAAMPGGADAWRDALAASPVVDLVATGADPAAEAGTRPLVLRDGRLYLRRYWNYERRVAGQVRRRVALVEAERDPEFDDAPDAASGDDAAVRRWLDRLFPAPAPGPGSGPDWQRVACAIALDGRFCVVTGGPGTGKTYTAARVLAAWVGLAHETARAAGETSGASGAAPRLRIGLAAPTGKAATRLRQSIDGALATLRAQLGDALPANALAASLGPAKTLHALLGARPGTRRFRHDAANPLPLDVLVVDEASMVHLEMMAALLDALPPGARLVLLGDKDQLASVEAGAVLGELCRDAERVRYTPATACRLLVRCGMPIPPVFIDEGGPPLAQRTAMLRDSVRFGGAIGELARAVNAGDAARTLALLPADAHGDVCRWPSPSPAAVVELALAGRAGSERAHGGYLGYLDAIRRRPAAAGEAVDAWAAAVLAAFDRVRVLCAVRDGEWGVVAIGRAIEQRLRDEKRLDGGEWYEGRPVLVTRNDRTLGIANGDIGIALRPPGSAALRVWFADGEGVRSVSVGRLADVETAFAMTVHKSQGSEFAHTVLVLPAEPSLVATRELVYTGITRAREALTVVARHDAMLVEAVARTARRSSGLHGLLASA